MELYILIMSKYTHHIFTFLSKVYFEFLSASPSFALLKKKRIEIIYALPKMKKKQRKRKIQKILRHFGVTSRAFFIINFIQIRLMNLIKIF